MKPVAHLAILTIAALSAGAILADEPEANLLRRLAELDVLDGEASARTIASQERIEFEKPPMEIARFCGDCHAFPDPRQFEKQAWYEYVRSGYGFYVHSGRNDLEPPTFEQVLAYFQKHAPKEIHFPDAPNVDADWHTRFLKTKLDWNEGGYVTPAIAHLQWTDLVAPGKFHLIASDMRDGSISLIQPNRNPSLATRSVLARLNSPARLSTCDLDQDGNRDFVVSELGSINPFDHQFGKVVYFRRVPNAQEFARQDLLTERGRIADLAVADFTQDGSPDILLAEFGHRERGGISLLAQQEHDEGEPLKFELHPIDLRPGTVRLFPGDWDALAGLDFIALTTQEYESLELFSSWPTAARHQVQFMRNSINSGLDLTTGSVGLESVDLDQDGDLDLIYCHGDCFDDNYAHRSHGVDWFENLGAGNFQKHALLQLPGAYQSATIDLDNDTDLDILVVANLPAYAQPRSLKAAKKASIVLLEQTSLHTFEPHILEVASPRYPAIATGDFDQDGWNDFAVGAQLFGTDPAGSPAAQLPRLTIWWNRGGEKNK